VRFDELLLEIDGEAVRIPFHAHVTVLAGLGPGERRELADHLMAALAGGATRATVHCTDGSGEQLVISGGPDGVTAKRGDGSAAAPPVGAIARSADALRALLVVGAPPTRARRREDEPADLRAARDRLEELSSQLEDAEAIAEEVATGEAALAALDEAIRAAQAGAARRAYAQVLADLAELEAERDALGADRETVGADRRLLAAADRVGAEIAEWRDAEAAREAISALVGLAGDVEGVDAEAALRVPEHVPEDLDALLAVVYEARSSLVDLDRRLSELAASHLSEPSDPAVPALAALDPEALEAASRTVALAEVKVREAQLELGGLDVAGGLDREVLRRIEHAHAVTEAADAAATARRGPALGASVGGIGLVALAVLAGAPLLAPAGLAVTAAASVLGLHRPRASAEAAAADERAVLEQVGVPSYLGFHLRRVDATIDPSLRHRAEAAAAERAEALVTWRALAGPDIAPLRAAELRDEVRAYRAALRALGGAADEIEQLQRRRSTELEPALREATAALAAACEPYGVEVGKDPSRLRQQVHAVVDRGRAARAARERSAAEDHARLAAERLEGSLLELIRRGAPLDEAVAAFDLELTRAAARDRARSRARDLNELHSRIDELASRARELHRPEWDEVEAADADGPSEEDLLAERAALVGRLKIAGEHLVDVERVADLHGAAQRRVAALEAKLLDPEASGSAAEVQDHLSAAFAAAAQAGPHRDPVPLLLDDLISHAPPDRCWELLDRLVRMAEHHQVIYLTDDPFVAAWAMHADSRAVSLLEPQPEPEPEPVPG
jgi:hypothetical protein